MVSFGVVLVATGENLHDVVETRKIFLLYLNPELLQVVCDRVFLYQQRGWLGQKIEDSFALTELSILALRLFRSGRVETLEFYLPDLDLWFVVGEGPGSLFNLILLAGDFFLNLVFSLFDEPLDEACVVLLSVDHIFLSSQPHHRPFLLLLQIHNSV